MFIAPNQYPIGFSRIFVHNLRLMCSIGAYEHEWNKKQKVQFNCDVWVQEVSTEDRLRKTALNYDFIVNTITEISQTKHYHLQEYLLEQCVDQLLKHPNIIAIRMSSAKLEAYSHVQAVGVEIYRSKRISNQ